MEYLWFTFMKNVVFFLLIAELDSRYKLMNYVYRFIKIKFMDQLRWYFEIKDGKNSSTSAHFYLSLVYNRRRGKGSE